MNNNETSILIVDDNPQYASLLKRIIEHLCQGVEVSMIHEIKAAKEEIVKNPQKFQLLFVDFRFPSGETGGDLIRQLKEQDLLKDKVAILVTSEPSAENVSEAQKNGVLAVVAKPFDKEQIRIQIERAKKILELNASESF
ncbi:MAG TPA: response regulator [Oligoflexia bacterium]|nr:response regulator [Oligoflexia bacterium]HMP27920.1 response regulator [Oligoflexia bacterium]